jgi:ADP-ribose pyrophosphatase
MADPKFVRIDSEPIYSGHVITLSIDTFRHADGAVVKREVAAHPGAVAIVAHDDEFIYLVKQPREATGEQSLLEIPAGKIDRTLDGENLEDAPLLTAKRELAEEIGKAAEHWEHLCSGYTSPGFCDEFLHVYLATGLTDTHAEPEEYERIEIIKHPLAELDRLIEEVRDAKTLIGLLQLKVARSR